MEPRIVLPELLPDGTSLLKDADFDRRLHYGDASLGWTGDERLGVYLADDRVELRRLCEDGELRLVMRSKPGHRRLDTDTLRFLAEHDGQSRRRFSGQEVIDHNQRLIAAKEDYARQAREEAADRLHFALRKDVGAHIGGLQKRQHKLGTWRKDDTE